MRDSALAAVLDADDLLRPLEGAIVRVPHLVRGRLVVPPPIAAEEAWSALADNDYARVPPTGDRPGGQLLRERLFDRTAMRATGRERLLVLPDIAPADLTPSDPAALRAALARLPLDAALAWLDEAGARLRLDGPLGARLRELVAEASDLPDDLLDAGLQTCSAMLGQGAVRAVVDAELALGGYPGCALLDDWVPIASLTWDGPSADLQRRLPDAPNTLESVAPPTVRALPTLQLHITAGNSPVVAPSSAVRALSTKSGAVVKLPAGAVLPGAALGLALSLASAAHSAVEPLLEATSLVYWRGGDARIEDPLFDPRVFDRVVVWGAPEAVRSAAARAAQSGIRTVIFRPRYGISLIGEAAFESAQTLAGVARRAAADTLIWNQRACIASLVHYVEGDAESSSRYATALRQALAALTDLAPPSPSSAAVGAIRRLRRGKLIGADWQMVGSGRDTRAAVVEVPGPFEMADHPLARLVAVRRVDRLEDALAHCHPGVSTAGVYPESRRLALRDRIAARGVSNVFPLGRCERAWAGMPHDGMRVLSELVEWANG